MLLILTDSSESREPKCHSVIELSRSKFRVVIITMSQWNLSSSFEVDAPAVSVWENKLREGIFKAPLTSPVMTHTCVKLRDMPYICIDMLVPLDHLAIEKRHSSSCHVGHGVSRRSKTWYHQQLTKDNMPVCGYHETRIISPQRWVPNRR